MGDLIMWLRAQLYDDEQIAKVADGACWHVETCDGPSISEHFERHSTTFALADVAAKRAILDEIAGWRHDFHGEYEQDDCAVHTGSDCNCDLDARRDRLVRLLAAPYADRPGYRDEWRPHGQG